MTTFLISLCYIIFGALVASCALCILYLLFKGLYLSILKWYYKPNKSSKITLVATLECAPNKIIVLNEVSYKCIIQQHDTTDRCLQCSLNTLFADCLSVNCMPEVEGEFKFYKLLKQ